MYYTVRAKFIEQSAISNQNLPLSDENLLNFGQHVWNRFQCFIILSNVYNFCFLEALLKIQNGLAKTLLGQG
jgi:hypothetical protein